MSDNNIVQFPGDHYGELPPETPLEDALKADLKSVVIAGRGKDGQVHLWSSLSKKGDILLLLEEFKFSLLEH